VPKLLHAPEPPADLGSIALPLAPTPANWFRLSQRKHPSGCYWSRSGEYRFDSPAAKWGICYMAESIPSAFQEVWGDAIRRNGRLDWAELANTVAWQITLAPDVKTIELAGPTCDGFNWRRRNRCKSRRRFFGRFSTL
jgi:hypothetical protein